MGKNGKLRVGVAQMAPRLGDLDRNLKAHLRLIEKAKSDHVELLVFPELSLSGYPQDVDTFHEAAVFRESETISALEKASGNICIVAGLIEESYAAQFYNTSVAIRDGEILHLHRKLNLATYGNLEEAKFFAQGRYVDAFNLDWWWRICMLVCADVWNPALAHLAVLHGATLLVIPTNSARDAVSSEFSNPNGWETVTRFYAMIYGIPIVMANRVGSERSLNFWGGSRIIDPFGHIAAQAGEDDEELLVLDLAYEDVRKARLQLPTVRDSNLSLVHREISRLQDIIGVPTMVR